MEILVSIFRSEHEMNMYAIEGRGGWAMSADNYTHNSP